MGQCIRTGDSTRQEGIWQCADNADAMHLAEDLEAEGYTTTVTFDGQQYRVYYLCESEEGCGGA